MMVAKEQAIEQYKGSYKQSEDDDGPYNSIQDRLSQLEIHANSANSNKRKVIDSFLNDIDRQ